MFQVWGLSHVPQTLPKAHRVHREYKAPRDQLARKVPSDRKVYPEMRATAVLPDTQVGQVGQVPRAAPDLTA
jgi:hypothetical protein